MCGRFVASSPVAVLVDTFSVQLVLVEDTGPRFNVAPTDQVRVVVERDGVRTLEARRWGLVPHWASDASEAGGHINARAETVAETPAFRDAFARRRCLVPADGFYEWKRRPDGAKQPCFVRATDGRQLALAGLRATWDGPVSTGGTTALVGDGGALRTCAIITTAPNELLRPVHDRMPAILHERDWEAWLAGDVDDRAALLAMLRPAPEDLLEVIPVGTGVNSVRNDGPALIERVPEAVQDALPF